nr:hypothetical protein [Lachnospiraceae bacterium]
YNTGIYFSMDNIEDIWFTYEMKAEGVYIAKAIKMEDLFNNNEEGRYVEYSGELQKKLLHCPN